MRVDRASASLILSLIGVLTSASLAPAQWLKYPTPGIPRTVNGRPNLSAPAPRTRDGKPDLSGLWRVGERIDSDYKPSDALPWPVEATKQLQARAGYDSWAVRCLPPGPNITFAGGPFRIIQTAAMTAMLYEISNNFRQVFTDGRPLPKDPNPTWQGYSVGRWDGDTFVVETIGFNDKSPVGRPPLPHTEALRVTERYRRRDFGHIELTTIVDDPKAFTRVWTMHAELVFAADDELLEFVCNENEKDRERIAATPQTDGNAVSIDVDTLKKYVGIYDVTRLNGAITPVTIALEDDYLTLKTGDRPPQAMTPQSATMFTTRGVAVEFVPNERGEFTQLIAHAVEGEMKGTRRSGP